MIVSESVKRRIITRKIATNVEKHSCQFVELMEFNMIMNVNALAKVPAKNTVMEVVLKKNHVPDVLEFSPQSAVRKESLMITNVIWNVLRIKV